MTDLFDHQITDGLRRAATDISVAGDSFGEVRRRVRARRMRRVCVTVVPAVAGMAWIGTRTAVAPNPPSRGAAVGATSAQSEAATDTAVPLSTAATEATSIGVEATDCTDPGCDVPVASAHATGAARADRVARSDRVFEALGFPKGELTNGTADAVQIHAADPTRPDQRQITLVIRQGNPDEAVVETLSRVEQTGVLVIHQSQDGWIYELEVVDTAGTELPIGDQALQLLATTFG